MDLTNKEELLKYLKMHGLWAKKGLGQNFLVDKNALDKIVEVAELKDSDLVIEIGPGVGTLTEELITRAGEVIAVEMDDKLAELLAQHYCHSEFISESQSDGIPKQVRDDKGGVRDDKKKIKIINADILKLNLSEVVGGRPYKVVANIPYYITSKILELFLSSDHKPETIVLLVQKEVAERICAKPAVRGSEEPSGSRRGAMSVLSVSVQLYGKPEIVGIVPASSFFPSPKIDSAILRIKNIGHPEFISGSPDDGIPKRVRDDKLFNEKDFFRTVHIGFASRRKTLINNLSAGYRIDKSSASDIIKSVGLSENVRAQELSILNWASLAKILAKE